MSAEQLEVIGALIIGGLIVAVPVIVCFAVAIVGAIYGCRRSSQISQERGEE